MNSDRDSRQTGPIEYAGRLGHNPGGVGKLAAVFPRVAEYSNPGLEDGSPSGKRQIEGVKPFVSDDPDSERIFWQEGGVHQNLTFPVHPDPVSGMHCWHQRVRVERAESDDKYGDVVVDTKASHEVYRKWLEMTRSAPGPGGLRRPLWFSRPVRPDDEAYVVKD